MKRRAPTITLALDNDVREANKVTFNRALTYEAQKRYEEAFEDLKKSAELDPSWRQAQDRLSLYRDKFGFTS